MSEGPIKYFDINWDSLNIDTSKAGKYTYEGSIEGYPDKVTLILTIKNYEDELDRELDIVEYKGAKYIEIGSLWTKYGDYKYNNKRYYFYPNFVSYSDKSDNSFYLLRTKIPIQVLDGDDYIPYEYFKDTIYPLIKNNAEGFRP